LLYMPILFVFSHIFDTARMISMSQPVTDYLATILSVILFIITYKKSFAAIPHDNKTVHEGAV
ncbi:MAG: hypothetical protein IJ801_00605, partial [Lachnospiraceae bacterium]|nr:hypothetical protein [Lachnospiraceae bacterium]